MLYLDVLLGVWQLDEAAALAECWEGRGNDMGGLEGQGRDMGEHSQERAQPGERTARREHSRAGESWGGLGRAGGTQTDRGEDH